ncbi:hypothetical protein [Nostoc sp.]|uniref:hypothetical protein n=1 Tax=Nostoc sp. TaxID=1180 RepID=UPI002FF8B743
MSPSAYPYHYSKAFASDSIFPVRCIQLAPTWYRPIKGNDRLLRSEQPLLEPLEMMLSTGFFGSAYWSMENCQPLILCLLAPAQKALFRWFRVTMVQTHLCLRYSWVHARREPA